MAPKLKAAATRALDLQLDFTRYYESDEGVQVCAYFLKDMVDKGNLPGMAAVENDPDEYRDTDEYAAKTGIRIAMEMSDALSTAPTFYMTDEMFDLNSLAAEQIPSIVFQEADLPTQSGFLLLPEPLVVVDVNEKLLSARALAWWKSELRVPVRTNDGPEVATVPCLMFALFSNKNDWAVDETMQDIRENHPREWLLWPTWQMCHWTFIFFNKAFASLEGRPGIQIQVDVSKETMSEQGFIGDDQAEVDFNTEHEGTTTGSFYAFLRTFFLLVKQKVAVIHPQHPDRAGMRRWTAAGLPPELGTMQIVTLRKERPTTDTDESEDEAQEWSHRWIVSGHWRNQWYPSLRTHVPVWINSYIKGPDDRPLIVKNKVFLWKR